MLASFKVFDITFLPLHLVR